LIPPGPQLDIDDLNVELREIWSALHEKLFGDHIDKSSVYPETTKVYLDAELFQRRLAEKIHLTMYGRYATTFAKFNPKSKVARDAATQNEEQQEREDRVTAASIRVLANRLKRKGLDEQAKDVVEPPSKVARFDSPKN
jgi:hypothetical protein